MIPGPNTVLVIETTCTKGRKAGVSIVLGIVTSVYFHALLAGLGLSLIVMNSKAVYELLKLLGASYIIYLGLTSLVGAYRLHHMDQEAYFECWGKGNDAPPPSPKNIWRTCYSQGLLTSILNPKLAIVFLAFFPQFLHQQGNIMIQSVILTVIYSLVSASWYISLVLFVGSMHQFIMSQGVQKWLKTVAGATLIGLGIRMIVQI